MEQFKLGSRFYFSRMNAVEQKIYRSIYDCWITGDCVAEVTIPGKDFMLPTGMELKTMVRYIIQDNPHLFHLETTQINYQRVGDRVTISTDNVYTPAEYKKIYGGLLEKTKKVLAGASKCKTDYEKFRYLHDYLARNVVYKLNVSGKKAQREIHTIVGPLLNGACVCDGYARAFRLLCDQLKLSCIVVSGMAVADGKEERHAWNFVRLNGKVYHVDVTWDGSLIQNPYPMQDHYFLRNDKVFSKSHSWDPKVFPPIADDYPRQHLSMASKADMRKIVHAYAVKAPCEVTAAVFGSFTSLEAVSKTLKEIIHADLDHFPKLKSYSCTYYDLGYATLKFE